MAGRMIVRLDVGTEHVRVMIPRIRTIYDEPNLALFESETQQFTDVGNQAARKGTRSEKRVIKYGFKNGVIADYNATLSVLKAALRSVLPRWLITKPDAIVSIAAGANSTERHAWLDVLAEVGFRQVYLLPSPQASALGSGLMITEPHGCLIVHLGAGAMDVAMFSLGDSLHHAELRYGGQNLDEVIQRRVQRLYGIRISLNDAKSIKESYLSLDPSKNQLPRNIKGTSIRKGIKQSVALKNEALSPTIETFFEPLIRNIKQVIEASSPELVSDVIDDGILLTGGLAQLKGLAPYISKKLKVSCVVAPEPSLTVLRGLHLATTHIEDYKKMQD